MKLIALCPLFLIISDLFAWATDEFRFDSTNPVVQVHVGTSGVLGFLGHEHLVQAPIMRGTLRYDAHDPTQISVELAVDARSLQVVDPELSAGDRKKIRATMTGPKILAVNEYPTISFKSARVEAEGNHRLLIRGSLTVRDHTRQVILHANLEQTQALLRATGQCRFKQTEFGIRPVTVGLGTVRVQDEVTVSFQIVARPAQGPQ